MATKPAGGKMQALKPASVMVSKRRSHLPAAFLAANRDNPRHRSPAVGQKQIVFTLFTCGLVSA
jgi:hypothetical protein